MYCKNQKTYKIVMLFLILVIGIVSVSLSNFIPSSLNEKAIYFLLPFILILGACLFFVKWNIMFFLLAFSLAIQFQDPAPFEILLIAILIRFIFAYKINNLVREDGIILLIIFLLILCNTISVLAATDKVGSFIWNAITIVLIISMALLRFGLDNVYHMKNFLRGYIVGGVLTSVISIIGYVMVTPYSHIVVKFNIRLTGFFQDPNVFSPYLVPIVIFLLEDIKTNFLFKAKFKYAKYLSILTVVSAIILAMSRAAWINLAISIGIYLLFNLYQRKIKVSKLILSSLLMGLIAYGVLELLSINIIEQINQRTQIQGYDSERMESQLFALKVASENLFFGVGAGQYTSVYFLSPHNTFFRILAETGILTCIVFIILLSYTILKLWLVCNKKYEYNLPIIVLALIIGEVINATVVDILHWRHFWVLMGLGWFGIVNYQVLLRK